MNPSALVALSGGVDSSFALALCQDRFYNVRAGYVDVTGQPPPPAVIHVTKKLNIDLTVIQARRIFQEEIAGWSRLQLEKGLTPNPCARCNARVKLRLLHRELQDTEVLVTGHYVRRSGHSLRRGADSGKDQSYFLSMVSREILNRCRFPLGDMTKDEVRRRAEEMDLPFRRSESMDLCFHLIRGGTGGRILDTRGNILGEHSGIGGFTVGQRKGLGALGRKMYVISIDPGTGTVVAGLRKDLLSTGCRIAETNWLEDELDFPEDFLVQTRYRRPPVRAAVDYGGDCFHIEYLEPEEAVAPGQICAVYRDDVLVGGGIITSTERLR